MAKCDICDGKAKEKVDAKGNTIYTCTVPTCAYVVQYP